VVVFEHEKDENAEKSVKNAAPPAAAAPATVTAYRVLKTSYPSSGGCYAGQDLDDDYIEACTTRSVVGVYKTEKAALKAALVARNSTCQFEGWAEEFYDDNETPPPYESYEGENYDEDENVSIYIEKFERSKKEEVAAEKKKKEEKREKEAKAAARKKQNKYRTKAPARRKVVETAVA
jgi:hypothetical protein